MDKTLKEELKPCPFCGKPVKYIGYIFNGNNPQKEGNTFGCSGSCRWTINDKSYARAFKKTNRRIIEAFPAHEMNGQTA